MNATDAAIALAAQTGLGFVAQWLLFGPRKINQWVAYTGLALAAVGLFLWANREVVSLAHADWRLLVLQFVTFVQAARGAAGMSKDAKVAPETNKA